MAQKRLNELKINTFMSDGQKYGVVFTDQTELSFGTFEPGDLFMVQKNSSTKTLQSPNVKILGEGQEVLVSKILSKTLS